MVRIGQTRTPKEVLFVCTKFVSNWVRGMDGLVVCAMRGARRRRAFEPRFVRPSRGLLARSPPPPPLVSPCTIGAAGGWVACFVLVFFSPVHGTEHTKTKHYAHHTCHSAPRRRYRRPTGAAYPPRIPLRLTCRRRFEPGSSGVRPAAQPLHAATNRHCGH